VTGVGIHTPKWNWREVVDIEVGSELEVVHRLRELVKESRFSDGVSEDGPYTAGRKEERSQSRSSGRSGKVE